MTLPREVQDAVDQLRDLAEAGDWLTSEDVDAEKIVRSHLLSQESEIDGLKHDVIAGQFDYIALRERLDRAESRLAAANALLRDLAMGHGVMDDRIQAHLQGAGDE